MKVSAPKAKQMDDMDIAELEAMQAHWLKVMEKKEREIFEASKKAHNCALAIHEAVKEQMRRSNVQG